MEDLTKLSGPELADWLDTVAAGYDRLSSMPGRTSAEGDRLRESARRLREDTREWQRNLERERDGLRERVRELEEEITGSDCDDAHEWLEMLYQGSESRGNPHGFAWTIKNELQFASMEIGNVKADRDEWRTQRELDAGSLRSAINNAQSRLAQVKRLEAQLREAQNAGADEWTAGGEAVPPSAVVRYEDATSHWPLGKTDAHAVSTAELTPFEIAAANACDAMHVDADGLGFVKREWLDRYRANVQKQRQAMDEPAIETITSWSVGKVLHALDRHVSAEALDTMAAKYLRELLTKLDAVTGLAQRWESAAHALGDDHPTARYAQELREVLHGKR